MLSDQELKKLIVSWKQKMGIRVHGQMVVPTDTDSRVDMYKHLIETLINKHKYTEEELNMSSTINPIVAASVAKSKNKDRWIELCEESWTIAMLSFFDSEILIHDTSNDPKVIILPERPKLEDTPRQSYDRGPYEPLIELENPIDLSQLDTGIPVPDYEDDFSIFERPSDE